MIGPPEPTYKRRDIQKLFRKYEINGHHAGEFANLIDRANRQGWTTQQFKHQVTNSKAFDEKFPGIKDSNGGLKMPPAQYDATAKAYQQQARTYNLHLSPKQMGALVQADVSAQEVADRFDAIRRFKEYEPALRQFIQALESRGHKVPANLKTTDGLINFILGQGPHDFYRIWEEATIGTAAWQAGVELGSPAEKWLRKSIPGHMSEGELQTKFTSMAQNIKKLMPLSKIYGLGLTKRDLAVLEFGGRSKRGRTQADVAEQVDRILATADAFENEKRGTTDVEIGSRGGQTT